MIELATAFLMVSGFLLGAGLFIFLLGVIVYLWGSDGS